MKETGIAAIIAVICSFLGLFDYGEEQIKDAYALMEKQQYEEAQQEFEAALELCEETHERYEDKEKETYVLTEAYRGLGMAAYEMEDYTNASAYFQKALDAGAEGTVIFYNMFGISALKAEEYEAALNAFENGIALAETEKTTDTEMYREMYFNSIICCEYLADWENARLKADAYLALYPDDEAVQKEKIFLKTR